MCGVMSRGGEARRWIYGLSVHLHQESSQSFSIVVGFGKLPEVSRVEENALCPENDEEEGVWTLTLWGIAS
jgi:hypothetical protein